MTPRKLFPASQQKKIDFDKIMRPLVAWVLVPWKIVQTSMRIDVATEHEISMEPQDLFFTIYDKY